jgi:nicotinamidase-related amidase
MKALFVIDMLNDFMPKHVYARAKLPVEPAAAIIANVKRLVERVREKSIPIFYLNDSHPINDPEFKQWPVHAVKGSEGAQVVKELSPTKGDYVIEKTTYDGFTNPELDKILKRLGVKTIYESGVVTNICVYETARTALSKGYEVYIVQDAVSGLKSQSDGMKKILELKVKVIRTSEAIKQL